LRFTTINSLQDFNAVHRDFTTHCSLNSHEFLLYVDYLYNKAVLGCHTFGKKYSEIGREKNLERRLMRKATSKENGHRCGIIAS
jgi:hypothetical protein